MSSPNGNNNLTCPPKVKNLSESAFDWEEFAKPEKGALRFYSESDETNPPIYDIEVIPGLNGNVLTFPKNQDKKNWVKSHFRKHSRGYFLFPLDQSKGHPEQDWNMIFSIPYKVPPEEEEDYKNYNKDPYSKGYPNNALKDNTFRRVPYSSYNEQGTFEIGPSLKRQHRILSTTRGDCICPKKLKGGDSNCFSCYKIVLKKGEIVIFEYAKEIMYFIDSIKTSKHKALEVKVPGSVPKRYFINIGEDVIGHIPREFTKSSLLRFWENVCPYIYCKVDPGLAAKLSWQIYKSSTFMMSNPCFDNDGSFIGWDESIELEPV